MEQGITEPLKTLNQMGIGLIGGVQGNPYSVDTHDVNSFADSIKKASSEYDDFPYMGGYLKGVDSFSYFDSCLDKINKELNQT